MRVLALPQLGKDDYMMPRIYRHISLLPVKSKIVETIVSRRLSRVLESRRLLSPFQFGFWTGKEVMGACNRLTHDVVQAFRQQQQV